SMSGGEQQMVAVGRAMMANPKVLMLDEPSLGLSPLLCKELFQSLSHVRDTGIGVLMVEQNAKQSLAISDRAYLLENGTITCENTAQAMLNDPAVQAAYLGGPRGTADPVPAVVQPADEVGAGEAPGLATPKHIQPSRITQTNGASDPYAGVDIGSIVARASDLAKLRPQKPAQQLQETVLNSSDQSSNIGSINGTSIGPIVASDPGVQELLADIESAALRASKSKTGGGSPTGNSSMVPQNQPESSEPLPEIPIFRKSKLEIYRRTPAGDLIKAEER
ncbi:MAG: ATP-binding cassette domain-containing protein, partial [Rhizobiaceae bacterium]